MTNQSTNTEQLNNSRRHFIRQAGISLSTLAACSLVAGNSISTAMAYTFKSNSADSDGFVFSQAQMQTLEHIAATILPKTDTPSGAELDCHGFIDHQLKYCHTRDKQQQAVKIIKKINQYCQTYYQQGFAELASEKQTQTLNSIEAEQGFSAIEKQQFKFVKALLVFGYFTTEVGATQALNYQAVPGGFTGSISYNEQSKAWGSLGFY
ncbi:gluconate 2-dehydrogenase subunit 3 family protein [Thalassotalea sp. PLHSN55]|uniref:gluconate 2-dehydrogenase subunit 3 family protein n=1 Tax=Thalassotalea sp. PLHSN55 TaxID=3435888 RepID=UPI003F83FC97